jgi:proton glutamate symport protein
VRRLSLTVWIFLGMAAGILLGALAPSLAVKLAPVSDVFLRLIKSVIAPLIFGTLVYGIAGGGSLRAMGRIGLKTILYFEIVTTIALFLGLAAVNLVQPGVGMRAGQALPLSEGGLTLSGVLHHVFPESVIDAMARGEVLQVVVFAFLFGAACAAIGAKARPVVEFCGALAEVMFRYTRYVMYLAPLGVGAALAVALGGEGFPVLAALGKFILTVCAAQAVFVVAVLGAVMAIARVPAVRFWQAAREPFLIAFSTATSVAALPKALENMERFGVPRHIVAFVLPTGCSFNLDGSTLYLSMASVFAAQAAGIHLTFSQQLLMMLTLMLTSKGLGGVRSAALVVLSGTLVMFGIPLEALALLIGIDAVTDMVRTSVNMLGNCLATAVVARWEGVTVFRSPSPN